MKPKLSAKRLREQAEENTNVVRKTRGRYASEKIEKAGNVLDHAIKHVNENKRLAESQIVGVSKGITKNMDNYESLRVDVWLTDKVKPDETVYQAYQRIGEIVDEQLERQVNSIIEED